MEPPAPPAPQAPPAILWDGSFLGLYPRTIIVSSTVVAKLTYWHLNLDGREIRVAARAVKDAFPCIVDELKTIFGLQKIGTHLIKVGGRLYLLIRVTEHQ